MKKFEVRECVYPWMWLNIDTDCEATPCRYTGKTIGNIDDGVEAVWNGPLIRQLREFILENRIHPICQDSGCPYICNRRQYSSSANQPDLSQNDFLTAHLFDEHYYLFNNTDVARSINEGTLPDGFTHFTQFCQSEKRKYRYTKQIIDYEFIHGFDDEWYLSKYPDVAIAIDNRLLNNAFEHFFIHGRFEKRQYRLSTRPQKVDNHKLSMMEYIQSKTHVESLPTVVVIEISNICNLKCVMCSHGPGLIKNPKHLPETVFEKIRPLVNPETRIVLGGANEPLMSRFFWKIINESEKLGNPLFRINTNGVLWNKKIAKLILKSQLSEISFSLDACTQDTYGKIRGWNLSKVLNNIKQVVKYRDKYQYRKTKLYINMTLMQENIRELVSFVELAHQLGVDGVRVCHLDLFSDSKDWVVRKKDWTFNYMEQILSNNPELSNLYIAQARRRAGELCVDFGIEDDRGIIL